MGSWWMSYFVPGLNLLSVNIEGCSPPRKYCIICHPPCDGQNCCRPNVLVNTATDYSGIAKMVVRMRALGRGWWMRHGGFLGDPLLVTIVFFVRRQKHCGLFKRNRCVSE